MVFAGNTRQYGFVVAEEIIKINRIQEEIRKEEIEFTRITLGGFRTLGDAGQVEKSWDVFKKNI